jgi:hypothetical protein
MEAKIFFMLIEFSLKIISGENQCNKDCFYYLFLLGFDFPAFFIAIAILCLCGLPECINSLILELIVFFELPRFRGIMIGF